MKIFNWIVNLKKTPKTKITLQGFADTVKKLGDEMGSDHYRVYVEQGPNHFKLYAYLNNPPRQEEGKTIEEVCEKLRHIKKEELSPITEVMF